MTSEEVPTSRDQMQQYVRAYIVEHEDKSTADASKRGNHNKVQEEPSPEELAIREIGRPYEGWALVVDTETTTDVSQTLRFGCYEVHGISRDKRLRLLKRGALDREALDTLADKGLFHNPDMNPDDLAVLTRYARLNGLKLMTKNDFVCEVFYKWIYGYQALCLNHNLAFDLSVLSATHGEGAGTYRNGFWFTLCDCGHEECINHPPLRIKHLGPMKNRIEFRSVSHHNSTGKKYTKHYKGKFLDTMTLGRALLGPGDCSLKGLCTKFQTDPKKSPDGDHGKALTDAYISYARQDVAATFSLYQKERELYRKHGLTKKIWKIFSEASLGKAYFEDLGVPRFMKQHPDFSPEVIGHSMVAYYGGRTEVNNRLQVVEGILLDFKSEYPSGHALVGLQELLLAERIEVRDCTHEIRELLESPDLLTLLQRKETWRRLRCFVRLKPNGAVLPVRGKYDQKTASTNIALVDVVGPSTWYTLADVIVSVLRTGNVPAFEEVQELVPHGRVETKPWNFLGDDRYAIDLNVEDFFTTVINFRDQVIRRQEACKKDSVEWEYFDGLQRGFKLLANATSYGIMVEDNPEERTYDTAPVDVYAMDHTERRTHVVEAVGPYFAGPIGTHIPAGGRLLIALAETLGVQRGLPNTFCDTDSIFFARPEGMERERFRALVREVVEWFSPLSPYADGDSILEIEKENYWEGKPEPLYFIGISLKRYALYNRCAGSETSDVGFRIRKFSSHGTGVWTSPGDYVSPTHVPAPCARDRDGNPDSYKLGGARWLYDLYYHFIERVEAGETRINLDGLPQLQHVAMHQVTMTTYQLWQQNKDTGAGPFGFFTVMPALGPFEASGKMHEWEIARGGNEEQAERVFREWEERQEQRRHATERWETLKKLIMDEGGIRRSEDYDIPKVLSRKKGLPVDVLAELLGFGYPDEFLEHVWAVKRAWDSSPILEPEPSTQEMYGDYLSKAYASENGERIVNPYSDITGVAFYAPRGQCFEDIRGKVRRMDTHELVDIEHKMLAQSLSGYCRYPCWKMANPKDVGWLRRRRVRVSNHVHIGKESNQVLEETAVESAGILSYADSADYGRSVPEELWTLPVMDIVTRTGLTRRHIRKLRAGDLPTSETRKRLVRLVAGNG